MCLVSIIIPYYNRKNTMIRAIRSVENQTFKDYELILINDGSTDDTQEIVKEYLKSKKMNVKFLSQKNAGPSAARNIGILNAKGKYIAFLDSDDSWEMRKLEIQVNYMEKNPQVMISGTNYNLVLDNIKYQKYKQKEVVKIDFKSMLFKLLYCMPTIVIRREIISNDLLFMEGKACAEDSLFYLRILRRYIGYRLPDSLTNIYKYEFGQGGLSENLSLITQNELENVKILYKENKKENIKITKCQLILILLIIRIKDIKRKLIAWIRSL